MPPAPPWSCCGTSSWTRWTGGRRLKRSAQTHDPHRYYPLCHWFALRGRHPGRTPFPQQARGRLVQFFDHCRRRRPVHQWSGGNPAARAGQGGTIYTLPQYGSSLRIAVDGLSAVFLGLIAVIAVFSSLYSIRYMTHYHDYGVGRFYPSFQFFIAACTASWPTATLCFSSVCSGS